VIHGEESHQVDAAVLALGTLPPRPLSGVSEAALASGRYVVDPWKLLAAPSIDPPPRKVVVIGLGLTAVDVLLELSAQWPQAQFTAISRHGTLPEAHLRAAAVPVGDSAELIESMRDAPEIRHWMHLLREAIAQDHTIDWRTIIDSLRPHTPGLWRELPGEERARFLRHARWAWERARHRMPPQVREMIATLEQNGRLLRQRGRMQSIDLVDGSLQLTLAPSHTGQSQTLSADLVIQTTGLDTDVRRTQDRLISQLLTNSHILPDPLGLGVLASPDGHLQHNGKHHEGTYWPHLFALGSLLRGTLWESTAMPEIRQQARHLADQLLTD
jgi:uncharacterized NAD(P)/FAD-binding protein YdhS